MFNLQEFFSVVVSCTRTNMTNSKSGAVFGAYRGTPATAAKIRVITLSHA